MKNLFLALLTIFLIASSFSNAYAQGEETIVFDNLGSEHVISADNPDDIFDMEKQFNVTKIHRTPEPLKDSGDIHARMILCPNNQSEVCVEISVVEEDGMIPKKLYKQVDHLVLSEDLKEVIYKKADYLKIKCADVNGGRIEDYINDGCVLVAIPYRVCTDRLDGDCLETKLYGAVWLDTII